MSEKKISYLARTFDDYETELLQFSNKYYPEITDSFNDASVGQWFIDLAAAVGDDLSYHIDRVFQDTNINTTQSRSSVMNIARMNGFKVPGAKASVCQVEISCRLPLSTEGVSQPDWRYAPYVKRDTTVACGNYSFELQEDVNFAEEFNHDGFNNRKFVPARDSNGGITAYTVSKTVIAVGIQRKIYKKVINSSDLEPFMTITLPDQNVGSVESVIFKETNDYSKNPSLSEYFYDEEEYQLKDEAINTYRYFETDSLADQFRFGSETSRNDEAKGLYKIVDKYVDYTASGTPIYRIYKGQWKSLSQKFVTEYTDNGYLNVVFGSGVRYDTVPEEANDYTKFDMAKLVNNNMMGVLPKEGWTMFILYNVVYGSTTNFASGSINTIKNLDAEIPATGTDATKRTLVSQSFSVSNTSNSVAGKDVPSTDEIKWMMRYNLSSQNRAVTVKDYKAKLLDMPPRYGCPFRSDVFEENNKIVLSLLGIDSKGKLDSILPNTLVNNAVEYLSHYKSINDYLEFRSGKIYNLYFELEVFVDKNYTTSEVLKNVMSVIKNYMDIEKHDMGEDVYLGDLEKEITSVDGMVSIITFDVYNVWGGASYSSDKCTLPEKGNPSLTNICSTDIKEPSVSLGVDAKYYNIDLEAIDGVLYCDHDSMFEIKYPSTNIAIKVKQI